MPAAMTLILLAQTDNTADAQQIHNRIWSLLEKVPGTELSSASAEAIGYEAQGWLELANLVRTAETGIDEQGRLIRGWQNNWPGHPAAQILPSELQLIATLADSRPEKIALALPLQGPLATAGKAIAAKAEMISVRRSLTSRPEGERMGSPCFCRLGFFYARSIGGAAAVRERQTPPCLCLCRPKGKKYDGVLALRSDR